MNGREARRRKKTDRPNFDLNKCVSRVHTIHMISFLFGNDLSAFLVIWFDLIRIDLNWIESFAVIAVPQPLCAGSKIFTLNWKLFRSNFVTIFLTKKQFKTNNHTLNDLLTLALIFFSLTFSAIDLLTIELRSVSILDFTKQKIKNFFLEKKKIKLV